MALTVPEDSFRSSWFEVFSGTCSLTISKSLFSPSTTIEEGMFRVVFVLTITALWGVRSISVLEIFSEAPCPVRLCIYLSFFLWKYNFSYLSSFIRPIKIQRDDRELLITLGLCPNLMLVCIKPVHFHHPIKTERFDRMSLNPIV